MPNYCFNRVDVFGSAEDIAAFKRFVSSPDSVFDFERVLPTPREIESVTFEIEIKGKLHRVCQEGGPNSDELVSKYGADNPIAWSRLHWGTKWNAIDAHLEADEVGELRYFFNTAWSPPYGIFRALREQFPGITLCWFYDEPMALLAGYISDDECTEWLNVRKPSVHTKCEPSLRNHRHLTPTRAT